MKKVLSLLVFIAILSSCSNDTTPEETQSGTVSQTGGLVEETQEETDTQDSQEPEEEISQETNQDDETQNEDYSFAEANSQTGSETETWVEVDAQLEISDSQEEQLIQETMDELNEFFELLENTDG